jgi:hypothetical protein
MGFVDAQDGDDRRFLAIVMNAIEAVPDEIRDLAIVRIDNWFDSKWLRFSGIGRVPFDEGGSSHVGVALDEFSQERLTFPPFTPRRILRQEVWTRSREKSPGLLVHPRILRHSAHNLHRRVMDFSDSMIAIWFSSRTAENEQGCVMQYGSHNGKLEAWYASLRLKDLAWGVHLSKGIDRGRVEALLLDDAPPSGTRCAK